LEAPVFLAFRFEAAQFVFLPDVRAEGDHFGIIFS